MYPQQAHAHKYIYKYIMACHTDQCSYAQRSHEPTSSFSCSSLALTDLPALSPVTGAADAWGPVTHSPMLAAGSCSCPAASTQTLTRSSHWHHGPMGLRLGSDSSCWPHTQTHRTDALKPGKELEVEFDMIGQTALVRSRAQPDKGVTYLHTPSPFYPLIPLFPCNKS